MQWKFPFSSDQEGRFYQIVLGVNGMVALAAERMDIALGSFAKLAVVVVLFRRRRADR